MKVSMQSVVGMLVLCLAATAVQAGESAGIAWRGQTFPAFKAAMERQVPLVIYFYGEDGSGKLSWSQKLEQGALASPELAAYAGKASFVRVDTSLDDANGNVKRLVESLKIVTVPTVSVLHSKSDALDEVGQIVGYYETAVFMEKFRTIHAQAVTTIAKELPAPSAAPAVIDEAALAGELIQKLRTESANSDAEEKKHIAWYQAVQKGEALDALQFTLTHSRVQNQIDVICGICDELDRLSSPEAKAAASALKGSVNCTRGVYAQHYRELLDLANKTGLSDAASRSDATHIATRFRQQLDESLKAMGEEIRGPVPAFMQRYNVR